MTIKRILKSLFIALVIGGLSYPAFLFINSYDEQYNTKVLIVFGTIGLLFLVASISLIGSIKIKS
ncbi:MAG: hypothetical protein WC389_20000 [Lutibacter sp.]|jgi:hypothetical protein